MTPPGGGLPSDRCLPRPALLVVVLLGFPAFVALPGSVVSSHRQYLCPPPPATVCHHRGHLISRAQSAREGFPVALTDSARDS